MNFDNKDLLGLVVIRSLFRRVRENVKGDFQLSRVSVRPPGGGSVRPSVYKEQLGSHCPDFHGN